jgi:hypothetical protein
MKVNAFRWNRALQGCAELIARRRMTLTLPAQTDLRVTRASLDDRLDCPIAPKGNGAISLAF